MKKIIMFFSVYLLLVLGVNAQTLSTDTFNAANGNMPLVGANFDVPIDVTGIDTIYTLTVYIEYDTTTLTYTGVANPVVPNIVVSPEGSNALKILVGTFPSQTIIPDGKLLDLQFDYNGGYSDLLFWTTAYGVYPSNMLIVSPYSTYNFTAGDVTNGSVGEYIISGGDWNTASNWSSNAIPTASIDAFVESGTETTIGAAAVANNLTIEEGGQLTLNSSTLNVSGDFLIVSDTNGSGSFINNGTLTVTGTSSAQCYVTNGQWHGIASPVSGEDFSAMYLGGNPEVWVKEYDETTNSYDPTFPDTTVSMGDMQGWFTWIEAASVPQTFTFTGAYRTGTIGSADNMANTNTGHNFIGNPFTSAIDWDASGWTKTNMYDAIYVYNFDNWAAYVNGGPGVNGGSQYIAMSQGFFVQVGGAGTGTLQMDVDVCVHNSVAYLKNQDTEQEIVRLQIEDAGMVDETVIVFKDGATEGFDGQFDAGKFFSFNPNYPQIYSTANDFMSINALPFEAMEESVALDVRGKDGSSLTISATEAEGFGDLSLKDKLTGDFVNLNDKSYTFLYDTAVTDRFTLFFSPTGIGDNPLSDDAVKIFAYDNNIQVVLKDLDRANISVYNLLGQEIIFVSANTNITRIPVDKTGYYLVKVSDGKYYTTKKVFIK